MLGVTPLLADGTDGSQDILGYLLAVEYMLDEEGSEVTASTWFGRLAEKQGLSPGSEAKAEQMRCLAQGYSADGKRTKLAENAGPEHKVGCDMTFSTPKSVGVVIAAAMARGDLKSANELIGACKKAVETTLTKMEEMGIIECKRGRGGIDYHASEGILASIHTHLANRNLEPHAHFHVLAYNLGYCNGKWGGMETRSLFDNKFSLDKLCQAEMAKNIKALGYGIRKKYGVDGLGKQTGVDDWDIAGIPQYLLDRFSTRHQEVQEYLEANPGALDAAIKTRKHKDEPTLAEMVKAWREDFELFEAQMAGSVPDFKALKGKADDIAIITDEEVFEKLHRNEAVITRNSLLARLAMERPDAGIEGIMAEFDRFKNLDEVVHVKPERVPGLKTKHPTQRYTLDRWTTKGMLQKESETLEMGLRHRNDTQHMLTREEVEKHIEELNAKLREKDPNAKLADEQVNAILHCTTKAGSVQLIQGRAGTGKTVSTQVVYEAYTEAGFNVIGGSTGWKAAKQLEEDSGAKSEALAKILSDLKKKRKSFDEKTVLIVDEAGMVSTKDGHAVMKAVLQKGGKIILQGDYLQLQAVGAGGMMRSLMETIGYAELKDIRRQASKEDRETAQMFYEGDSGKRSHLDPREERERSRRWFKRLDERGHIQRCETEKDALEALAKDFVKNPKRVEDKLVLGFDNNDVRALNKRIHAMRKKAGELGTAEYKVKTHTKFGVEQISLAKGDRIVFKENTRFGAMNNEVGTLTNIRQDENGVMQFEVKMDIDVNGKPRVVRFYESDCQNFSYGYAVTNHSAQGLTAKDVQALGNARMTNQQAMLVAYTRMKSNFKLYVSAASEEQIAATMGKQSLKSVALEEGVKPKEGSKLARTLKRVMDEREKHLKARVVKASKPAPPSKQPKAVEPFKRYQMPVVKAFIKQRWEALYGKDKKQAPQRPHKPRQK